MTDYLAGLPEPRVAAWYGRLAGKIAQTRVADQEPLAALFLRHYLANRDPASTFQFQAPVYLRQSPFVTSVLPYHRAVFLTEQRARMPGGREAWAGVLPRIQGLTGFSRWDLAASLEIHYESLVEVGSGLLEISRIQRSGTAEERDLLTSLRGFQLRSRVMVSGSRLPNAHVRITFVSWQCRISDRYDFDYTEHFTVPNPDFRSSLPDAVRPQDETLTVYHTNARRLERAGLAAPYDVLSDEWRVQDIGVAGPGEVDPARRL
jgi:hypothetical protein